MDNPEIQVTIEDSSAPPEVNYLPEETTIHLLTKWIDPDTQEVKRSVVLQNLREMNPHEQWDEYLAACYLNGWIASRNETEPPTPEGRYYMITKEAWQAMEKKPSGLIVWDNRRHVPSSPEMAILIKLYEMMDEGIVSADKLMAYGNELGNMAGFGAAVKLLRDKGWLMKTSEAIPSDHELTFLGKRALEDELGISISTESSIADY